MTHLQSEPAAGTRPRVQIDRIACTGHGVCARLLAGDVELDEWGYPIIVNDQVDEKLGAAAERLCPAAALRMLRR